MTYQCIFCPVAKNGRRRLGKEREREFVMRTVTEKVMYTKKHVYQKMEKKTRFLLVTLFIVN